LVIWRDSPSTSFTRRHSLNSCPVHLEFHKFLLPEQEELLSRRLPLAQKTILSQFSGFSISFNFTKTSSRRRGKKRRKQKNLNQASYAWTMSCFTVEGEHKLMSCLIRLR
jgi:hypothetical protein